MPATRPQRCVPAAAPLGCRDTWRGAGHMWEHIHTAAHPHCSTSTLLLLLLPSSQQRSSSQLCCCTPHRFGWGKEHRGDNAGGQSPLFPLCSAFSSGSCWESSPGMSVHSWLLQLLDKAEVTGSRLCWSFNRAKFS